FEIGSELRQRRIRAHAAGVRAAVAVEYRFVILEHPERDRVLAVTQGEEGYFLAGQKLFDHHSLPGRPEPAATHRIVDGTDCRLAIGAYRHALAQRQAVRLNDDRSTMVGDVTARRVCIVKRLIRGGRHARGLHHRFGERLAGLDLRGSPGRPENLYPRGSELVDDSRAQWIIGSHDDQVDLLLAREGD